MLPGRWVLAMAWRLPAYQGAIRRWALSLLDDGEAPVSQPALPRNATPAQIANAERREVPATQEALMAAPAFRGVFSFGKGAPATAAVPAGPAED